MKIRILSLLCAAALSCGGIYDNLCGVSRCDGGLTCQDTTVIVRDFGTLDGYACLAVTSQPTRTTVYTVGSACTPNLRAVGGWSNEATCPIVQGSVKVYEQAIRPLPKAQALRSVYLRDDSSAAPLTLKR